MTDNSPYPDGFQADFQETIQDLEELFGTIERDPANGRIDFGGDRYLLMRAESMSVRFFQLVRDLFADEGRKQAFAIAHNLLFDVSHAQGRSDARALAEHLDLESREEMLAAGPLHFAHSGWAVVNLLDESRPQPGPDYFLLYDHSHSFEAEAWMEADEAVDFPVCVMNSGYSSGWCAECFDTELVAAEILCRAKGDDCCRFVMAPPDSIEKRIEEYIQNAEDIAPTIDRYDVPGFFQRKTMEQKLRTKDRQLARADRMASLGTMAAGVAHEINNPLAFIISNIQYSLDELERGGEADLEEVREALRGAQKGAERVETTVGDLSTFSHDGQQDHVEPVDVEEALDFALQMIERTTRGADIQVQRRRNNPPEVRANHARLNQVFVNLLVNATQAFDRDAPAPEIVVGTGATRTGDFIFVEITDNGRGIPSEILERAFDPFFTTKPVGEGTGLGLAICHQIVEAIGGRLTIDSERGVGTSVRVELPTARGDADSHTATTTNTNPDKMTHERDEDE